MSHRIGWIRERPGNPGFQAIWRGPNCRTASAELPGPPGDNEENLVSSLGAGPSTAHIHRTSPSRSVSGADSCDVGCAISARRPCIPACGRHDGRRRIHGARAGDKGCLAGVVRLVAWTCRASSQSILFTMSSIDHSRFVTTATIAECRGWLAHPRSLSRVGTAHRPRRMPEDGGRCPPYQTTCPASRTGAAPTSCGCAARTARLSGQPGERARVVKYLDCPAKPGGFRTS
jgi:hypothetical protein